MIHHPNVIIVNALLINEVIFIVQKIKTGNNFGKHFQCPMVMNINSHPYQQSRESGWYAVSDWHKHGKIWSFYLHIVTNFPLLADPIASLPIPLNHEPLLEF
jgi:hypothetical protein